MEYNKLDLTVQMQVCLEFNVSLLKKYFKYRLLPKVVQVEDDADYGIE